MSRSKAAAETITALRTECRRLEQRLAESEAQVRALWEGAPVGLYRSKPDGTLLDVNRALVILLGYPDDKTLLSVNAATLYHDAGGRETWQALLEQQDVAFAVESRKRRYDGTIIWVEETARVVRDAAGRIAYYEGSMLDITERKRAEDALRASEARYRSVVEGSIQGIMVHRDGKVVFANGALARMAGYDDATQVVGRPMWEFIAPEERERIAGHIRARSRGEPTPSRYQFEGLRRDGRRRWLDCFVSPVEWDGAPAVLASVIDITERRDLEQQLAQAQKMEAIGRLAGGVAHDFNNILTAITGYTELLRENLAPDHPGHADLDEIRHTADRAAGLTQQLLAFSRRQVLEPRVLDPNDVVLGTRKLLGRLIGEDIALETKLAARGRVRVDPNQLGQVTMNLAVNARDAMPNGGRLVIETADVDVNEATAQAHHPMTAGPYVLLSVTDTGTGMTEEVKSRVFEPFFTTKPKGRGTGLGLATVYGIVKQSGGFVWVDSEPGRGTRFRIYLPRVPDTAEWAVPGEVTEAPRGGDETILLVEDEPAVRRIARQVLEGFGYRVLEAETPSRALGLLREHAAAVRLLLTDMVMPGMSGPDLHRRAAQERPGLAVLFMSGYPGEDAAGAPLGVAGAPFLAKPFTADGLARAVRQTLDGGAAPRS
ncbi:MAG TPA: PAS domain S-box protein [Gemmatimonadales bacterium]|nr:PAS domain S-box protein [Gemmatimonadales bacterium]